MADVTFDMLIAYVLTFGTAAAVLALVMTATGSFLWAYGAFLVVQFGTMPIRAYFFGRRERVLSSEPPTS